MARKQSTEKVTQQTWQKSYELDGQLNISTLVITPIYPTRKGDHLLTVGHSIEGRNSRRDSDAYIETATQVAERRIGLANTGYRLIDTRQVRLRSVAA